jgi:hypothetical protein
LLSEKYHLTSEDTSMKGLMCFGAMVCAAVLTACAGAAKPKMGAMLGEATGQNGRACVRQGDIQSYGVLKGNVITIDGFRNYYLATVLPGCNDLHTSIGVMFSGGFGEICGGGMDAIATGGGDSCTINKIYKFENREQALAVYKETFDKRAAVE